MSAPQATVFSYEKKEPAHNEGMQILCRGVRFVIEGRLPATRQHERRRL